MSDWQLIETAPKDGTGVLLSDGKVVTYGGYVNDGPAWDPYWWNSDGIDGHDFTPTHWMKLPDPPKEPS